jgi:hypothetical protein
MLDGRIDFQGTVSDLRAQGILDDIVTHGAGTESIKSALVTTEVLKVENDMKKTKDTQEPHKLVEDEHRELGGVKWSIYKSYLKSSYASSVSINSSSLINCRSYWIWGFLTFLVVINQVLSVGEKLWIKVAEFLSKTRYL